MKRIICTFLAVFLLVLGCAGCQPTGGNDPTPEPAPTPTSTPDDPKPDDEPTVQSPEQLLAAMTLEEKIDQLMQIPIGVDCNPNNVSDVKNFRPTIGSVLSYFGGPSKNPGSAFRASGDTM